MTSFLLLSSLHGESTTGTLAREGIPGHHGQGWRGVHLSIWLVD